MAEETKIQEAARGNRKERVGEVLSNKMAKTIVAINSDESAPIFDVADFGIIGDVFNVVPQLIQSIESRSA